MISSNPNLYSSSINVSEIVLLVRVRGLRVAEVNVWFFLCYFHFAFSSLVDELTKEIKQTVRLVFTNSLKYLLEFSFNCSQRIFFQVCKECNLKTITGKYA